MYSAKIKSLHDEYCELIEFCRANNQVSFEMYINDTYKKSLLLSVASYFETVITTAIHNYADTVSQHHADLVAFLDNKALKRQYHTFFYWDGNNVNQFLGLFGDTFKNEARKQIKDQDMVESERAFMSIGRERNQLVHQNYIESQINDTFDEIYLKYEKACTFVELIVNLFSS